MTPAPRSSFVLILWHLAAGGTLLMVLSQGVLGTAPWSLDLRMLAQIGGMTCAYSAFAIASTLLFRGENGRYFTGSLGILCLSLALYYLALLLAVPDPGRKILAGGTALYVTLWGFPLIAGPVVTLRATAGLLLATVTLGVIAIADSNERPDASAGGGSVVHTVFHPIRVTHYRNLLPYERRWGGIRGGMDTYGRGFLAVSGDGDFYLLQRSGKNLSVDPLQLRSPFDRQTFLRDTERAGAVVQGVWFNVAGLLVQDGGDNTQIIISYHHWDTDQQCVTLRVSSLSISRAELPYARGDQPWHLLYETQPCLPLKTVGHAFAGHQAGGRMVLINESQLLLTVGDQEYDGIASASALPQYADNDYGKTLLISLPEGGAEVYTLGHRNPQGLALAADGRVWLTEHGPSGGDELNLIEVGANYGWPLHTYGAQYGGFDWTPPSGLRQVEEIRSPAYTWIPSIGVSSVIALRGDAFPRWQGDLLVSSLVGAALYRVRVEDGRAVYAEMIPIGERIRDLAEGTDGSILLWTDDGTLIVLEPAGGAEGEVAFQLCVSCHSVSGESRIGPDLRGVVGRAVASKGNFSYSNALAGTGGVWTRERLDAFLRDPAAFAPGTTMGVPGIDDPWTRRVLVDYMETLAR
jgi:cytochrome c2